jgi:hypothetical protein
MAEFHRKNFADPDEVIDIPGVSVQVVDLGDLTVGKMVNEPGWRWSTHMRPVIRGDWCQARHVGFIISGRLGIEFADGTSAEFGAGDVFDIPPGHDGFTVGDEPCVQVEWTGLRAWAGFPTGIHSRVLATLLFTDLVDSTVLAAELGDTRCERFSPSCSSRAAASSSVSEGGRWTRRVTACSRGSKVPLELCTVRLRCNDVPRGMASRSGSEYTSARWSSWVRT